MKNGLTRIWIRRINSFQAGTPIEKVKIGAFRKLLSRPDYLPARILDRIDTAEYELQRSH